MKILFASRRPVYPLFLGGAELSFYELARGLSERGHEVLMMGEWSSKAGSLRAFLAQRPAGTFEWRVESEEAGGLPMPTTLRLSIRVQHRLTALHTLLSDFLTFLPEELLKFEPDVVCTHLDGAHEVIEFCNFFEVPVLHFVRDTFHSPNFHPLREREAKKRPTACVANSAFLADYLRTNFGVDSFVVYPIIAAPAGRSAPRPERNGRRVLFSNPAKVKGGEMMLEVVSRLPEVRFVVIPGWGAEVADGWLRLPNVEIREWPVLDMREVYESVDLVVVPTQDNEAFGRVAIEAQHLGVPVAASRHSGFEEALGESAALVESFRDPEAWRSTIRELLSSDESLERLSRSGRRNVERFSPEAILQRFETILESVA